jgi:hypothetical protein
LYTRSTPRSPSHSRPPRNTSSPGSATPLEQPLEQLQLRIEELSARLLVDDGDGAERHGAALTAPLRAEHRHEHVLQARGVGALDELLDRIAARALRLGQVDAQQCAAGVRVDLDQLGTVGRQVEVEAHEGAERTAIDVCGLGQTGERLRAVGVAAHCGLDGPHDRRHRLDLVPRQEHGRGGEQRRVRLEQVAVRPLLLRRRPEHSEQATLVQNEDAVRPLQGLERVNAARRLGRLGAHRPPRPRRARLAGSTPSQQFSVRKRISAPMASQSAL